MEFKRKLYKRGGSFETTVPIPLLFALDMKKKHNVFSSLISPRRNGMFSLRR